MHIHNNKYRVVLQIGLVTRTIIYYYVNKCLDKNDRN